MPSEGSLMTGSVLTFKILSFVFHTKEYCCCFLFDMELLHLFGDTCRNKDACVSVG